MFLISITETSALKCFVCGPDENCDRNFEDQTASCGISPVPNQLRYECVKYHIGKFLEKS